MIFFTVFIPLIIIFTIALRAQTRKEESIQKSFWDRELLANSTRRKDIENLPYIPFDISMIPLHPEIQDERIDEYIQELSALSGKRILNCTGKSNTDLKLEYGAPNITKLSEYDGNYTILVRSIARLAEKYLLHASLYLEDVSTQNSASDYVPASDGAADRLKEDARKILEYGISIGTDVRLNYELLADIYSESDNFAAIEKLKERAGELNSLSKEPILRMLERKTEGIASEVPAQ